MIPETSFNKSTFLTHKGFVETEIKKEKDVPIFEAQEFCEAPKPKEMIDLEVKTKHFYCFNFFINILFINF